MKTGIRWVSVWVFEICEMRTCIIVGPVCPLRRHAVVARFRRKSDEDGRRQIFQTCPPTGNVNYASLADALQTVADMRDTRDREDYCSTVGIDYGRVVKYYALVRALECCLETTAPASGAKRPAPAPLAVLLPHDRDASVAPSIDRMSVVLVAFRLLCALALQA